MDRRNSIKALVVGTFSTSILVNACKPGGKDDPKLAHEHKQDVKGDKKVDPYDEAIMKKVFFTEQEMKTITLLANIIIPADEHSGSAEDAGVPEFIHFMAKDRPEMQTPLRGGIKWMDMQCIKRHEKTFVDCSESQRMELVEQIAWPDKSNPQMLAGVSF